MSKNEHKEGEILKLHIYDRIDYDLLGEELAE